MAGFPLCAECRSEYSNPGNRRFHAQPIACPACGPRLMLRGRHGEPVDSPDPLARFVESLQQRQIGALKGLGGYHLVCDARCESTVSELRHRKQRDEKPFAIMVRDLAAVRRICEVDLLGQDLLHLPQAPIVLLKRRRTAEESVAVSVAPGNPCLGVMLPYTPLHHLLLEALEGVPLVMTSGNRSEEPTAYEDERAIESLSEIADVFLTHDRPIHVRCDDSVLRVVDNRVAPLRRSRGFAPEPLPLPLTSARPVLSVGGQLKCTFALASGDQAFVSHHLGDLDDYEAYRAFTLDIGLYEELLSISPAVIAHDLHPDYASTRYAETRGLPRIAVQHHHAHMASAMVEHGLQERVIGVTFDGAGLGPDGAIWGGEFLVGDLSGYRRTAHLRYVGMPGGERAVREPWRMAVAHLLDAGCDLARFPFLREPAAVRTMKNLLTRGAHPPLTSSMGRLFDAVAALAGIRSVVSYEGQAAMELEWRAASLPQLDAYPWTLEEGIVDTRPLIRAVADDTLRSVPSEVIARRFHTTVVDMIAGVCGRIRTVEELSKVILSGGVFQNELLACEARSRLSRDGFDVYCHERVPANDGGLSLGQAAVAVQQLNSRTCLAD